jgi:hypothetical protein
VTTARPLVSPAVGKKIVDKRRMYGAKEGEVEPVKHLIGSVLLWRDNREGCTLQLKK